MLDKCVAAGQGYEREGGPMDFTCIGIEDGPPICRKSNARYPAGVRFGSGCSAGTCCGA